MFQQRAWAVKAGIGAAVLLLLALGAACGTSTGGGEGAKTGAPPKTAAATSGVSSQEANAGKKIYQTNCATCHSIDGRIIVGPTWKGLYGHKVELESGQTITADDTYIKESIKSPNAKIVKGFPAAMPSFAGILSDEQINQVIAYIKTLN